MAKIPSFQNLNRYDQNVGKVLISRKMGLTNSKRQFLAKISLIPFFLNFGTREGSPYWSPIGPLFPHGENRRHGFFKLILSRLVVEAKAEVKAAVYSSGVSQSYTEMLLNSLNDYLGMR